MHALNLEFWELKRVFSLPADSALSKLENEWQIHIYQRYGKKQFKARLFRGEFFNLVPTNQLPVDEAPYDTAQLILAEEVGILDSILTRTEEEAVSQAFEIFQKKFTPPENSTNSTRNKPSR